MRLLKKSYHAGNLLQLLCLAVTCVFLIILSLFFALPAKTPPLVYLPANLALAALLLGIRFVRIARERNRRCQRDATSGAGPDHDTLVTPSCLT